MPFDIVTQAAFPQDETTHLHLLRHGKVDTGGQRLAYGHADFPLTAEGRRQSAALVDFAVRHLPQPTGVLSSDLGRCTSIAEPLAARLGVPLHVMPEIREQHMGAWEGRSWAELTVQHEAEVRAYWSDYADAVPSGGESYRQLTERVARWWHDRAPLLLGGRWLVLTHTGVIRALCCQMLGVPADQALRFAPPPSSHTHIVHAEAGGVLLALGERVLPRDDTDHVASDAAAADLASARAPRIALSGSAGTGKTTLGRALAERFGVPYLPEGMRRRLEAGLQLHDIGHDALRALLVELWEEQRREEDAAITAAGGFVADRSAVDFAAFWLHYHFTDDQPATESFFGQLFDSVDRYDRIVLLPWGVLPLEADGIRNPNPWLQRRYQATVEGLLYREVGAPRLAVLPPLRDFAERVAWVEDHLGALLSRRQ